VSRPRTVAPRQRLEADVVISGVVDERGNLVLRVPCYFAYIVLAGEYAGTITLLETAVDDAAPTRYIDHGLGAAGDLRPIGQRQHGELDDGRARRVGGFVRYE
jgi:hypothetical protein